MTATKEALLRGLSRIYEESQLALLRLVAERLARGTESPNWALDKLLELGYLRQDAQRVLRKTQREAVEQIVQIVQAFYSGGQADELETAVRLGLAGRTVAKGRGIVSESVKTLVAEGLSFTNKMGSRVLRDVDDVYRRVVAEASGLELSGALTRVQVMQRSLDRFADAGVTAVSVDGGIRAWWSHIDPTMPRY